MIRRTAVLGTALGLGASLLAASPSHGDEPLAAERYNAVVLIGGQAQSPGDIPRDRAALSDHAAFRVWSGSGESFVRSTTDLSRKGFESWDWPRAETMPYVPTTSSFAASAEDDYLVLATASREAGSVPARIRVQVVAAGATAVASDREVSLSVVGGLVQPAARVGAAATGPDVYLVGSSGSALTGDYRLQLLHSTDRGRTWSSPVDLPEVTGLDAGPGVPTPQVVADGPHLAVSLDKAARYTDPGRRSVLRSDDGGLTWTELGDPEPTTSGSAIGIGWRDGQLRAAWTVRSGGGVALRSSVSGPGSAWSAPEDLPDDDLGASPSPVAPVVHELGSTWAVQAPGGLLRTSWPTGWLRPHQIDLRERPIAVGGDRVLYEDFAYLPDLLPPSVSSYWDDFTPYQQRTQRTGLAVSDEGGLQTVDCWFDDAADTSATPSNPYCYTPEGYLDEGPHAMRILATDWAGRTTDRTLHWVTDETPPTFRWQHGSGRWVTGGRTVVWRWRGSDALTGIRHLGGQVTAGSNLTRLRPATLRRGPGLRSVRVRPGTTVCLDASVVDRATNVANRTRCATSAVDDSLLGSFRALPQVRGTAYDGGRATELRSGGDTLSLHVTGRRAVTGLAVRVLVCPSCGDLRVATGVRSYRVSLRAARTRVRTVTLPFPHRRARGLGVVVRRAGSGRVVVDGIFAETVEP